MMHAPIAPRPIDPLPGYGLLTAAGIAVGLSVLLVASALIAFTIVTVIGDHPVLVLFAVFLGGVGPFVASLLVLRRVRHRFVTRSA
ncbi:hypothetical protein [Natrialba sp. PRR66]|nr:hypothetical protein [Natrialba sp. PRR66]